MFRKVCAVAVLCLVVPAGCGGAGRLDTREVERALVADYAVVDGVVNDRAECPNQVDRGAGGSFVCTLTLDGQTLEVRVVQVDDEGTVRFEQLQTVLASAEVAEQVAAQVGRELGQIVTATCGTSAVIVVGDDGFTCTVLDESGSTLEVTAEVGDDGEVVVAPA
jgi:hypothetical protein